MQRGVAAVALDIGAAPGGWTSCLLGAPANCGGGFHHVIAVDPAALVLPVHVTVNILCPYHYTITPPIPLPLITLFDIRIRTWISNPSVETEWAAGRVSHLQEGGEAAVKYLLRLQQAHRDYALGAEEELEPSELDAAVARGHGNIYVYNIHI